MMKKIILFLFLIVSNCSYFDNTSKVVICPKLTSPKGTEEILLISKNNIKTYIGFRGIKSICYKMNNDDINMKLEVNLRAIRKNTQLDDYLPVTLALVSINDKGKESDRDEISFEFFLRSNRKLIERATLMEVIIPKKGQALLGIIKK